jgi:type IV pilus assembly protein PilW
MTMRAIRQGGFTLIELMVGMVLGLFILIALLALLANVSRGNSELAKTNRMIENGRLAIQLMQGNISHAGFWSSYTPGFDDITVKWADEGGAAPTDVPAAVPDPCAPDWTSAAYKANVIGVPVAAYQVSGTFSRTTPGTGPICSSIVTDPVRGTDVLVVRHAEPCATGTGSDECAAVTNPSTDVYFQAQRCAPSGTFSAPFYMLETAPSGTPTFTLLERNCTTRATVHKYGSTLYYVKLVNGVPTLMMSRVSNGTQGTAQALIENVEAFVVELGLDNVSDTGAAVDFTAAIARTGTGYTSPSNRGDGNADTYVRCTSTTPCTAAQLMNVVSVKLYVLVRSEEPTAGVTDSNTYTLGTSGNSLVLTSAGDSYRRQLFTQTIRLPNISGRRETP